MKMKSMVAGIGVVLFSALALASPKEEESQIMAMLDRAQAMLDAAQLRGGGRAAADPIEAAQSWIEKADESRKRRSYPRARMQADLANIEAELADLISKVEATRAQRTQLEGAVAKLQQTWEADL